MALLNCCQLPIRDPIQVQTPKSTLNAARSSRQRDGSSSRFYSKPDRRFQTQGFGIVAADSCLEYESISSVQGSAPACHGSLWRQEAEFRRKFLLQKAFSSVLRTWNNDDDDEVLAARCPNNFSVFLLALLFGVLHSQSKGVERQMVNRVMFISLALPIFELKKKGGPGSGRP